VWLVRSDGVWLCVRTVEPNEPKDRTRIFGRADAGWLLDLAGLDRLAFHANGNVFGVEVFTRGKERAAQP
jgi:hypothetical protein